MALRYHHCHPWPPDTAVQEAKERVRAAIKNSGLVFPMRHIIVNLAPADIKKEGPILPMSHRLRLQHRTSSHSPWASIPDGF